ncbi:MAG: heme exporter protein CcmB [Chloroflexi bacterium]|nr:heme exporter protein CcmB [Chloroflexota bacterium]
MCAALATIWALARKDLLLEMRSREIVLAIVVFALLVITIFTFAIDLTPSRSRDVGPGVLWAAVAFAGVLGINRSFAMEAEGNTLDGLMLTPVSRELIFFGKSLGNFIFIAVAQVVIFPVFEALFNISVLRIETFVIALLASIGFAAVGTAFAAVSVRVRSREIMLPLLFLPTVIPLIMAAVESTSVVVNGGSWSGFSAWLQLAIAFDVIFVIASAVLFQFVLED